MNGLDRRRSICFDKVKIDEERFWVLDLFFESYGDSFMMFSILPRQILHLWCQKDEEWGFRENNVRIMIADLNQIGIYHDCSNLATFTNHLVYKPNNIQLSLF